MWTHFLCWSAFYLPLQPLPHPLHSLPLPSSHPLPPGPSSSTRHEQHTHLRVLFMFSCLPIPSLQPNMKMSRRFCVWDLPHFTLPADMKNAPIWMCFSCRLPPHCTPSS